jgi:hypothetical protein
MILEMLKNHPNKLMMPEIIQIDKLFSSLSIPLEIIYHRITLQCKMAIIIIINGATATKRVKASSS